MIWVFQGCQLHFTAIVKSSKKHGSVIWLSWVRWKISMAGWHTINLAEEFSKTGLCFKWWKSAFIVDFDVQQTVNIFLKSEQNTNWNFLLWIDLIHLFYWIVFHPFSAQMYLLQIDFSTIIYPPPTLKQTDI